MCSSQNRGIEMVLLTGFRRPARLEDVPGVGGRVAEKLREYFGGEDEAIDAIISCRLSLLGDAVGKAIAARIAQGVHKYSFGVWPREILRTEDAARIFSRIRDFFTRLLASQPGRDLLACLYPLDSDNIEVARRRLELVAKILESGCSVEGLEELRSRLEGLEWSKPVKPRKLRRTLIILGDYNAYLEAREKLGSLLDIAYVEDVAQVDRVAEERGEAIIYDPQGLYAGSLPRAYTLDPAEVAPEAIVEYFRVNWRVVEKIYEIITNTRCGKRLLEVMGVEESVVKEIEEKLRYALVLRGGDIDPMFDQEYRRLHEALKSLDRVADEVELWANNEIQSRLERLEVKLTAAQFLKLFSVLREGGETVELPDEIYEVFEEIGDEVEKRLAEKLGLEPDEAEIIKGVAPRTPVIPYSLERERLEQLRGYLREKLVRRRFEILRTIAERVRGLAEKLERMLEILAVLDVVVAEALLVKKGEAAIPEVSSEYHGVGFIEALELGLYGKPGVQRVSYVVGSAPFKPDAVKGERVILLTGANSGGKTTLLHTIAEIAMMAQTGLVVLARKAWVGASDKIYFFSKPAGMVDAGALETTLRILAAIATGRGRRLVLVDELEAATEASAAARIMAVVVRRLCAARDVVAVIVTHLAREILSVIDGEKLAGCLRVDGIEAKGLDENYNLIVDRNPRFYYLARSTPELVVQKLLHRAKSGEEKMFYKELLEVLSSR